MTNTQYLLPEEITGDAIRNLELDQYRRHLEGDYDYTVLIGGQPTPRPRARIMNKRGGQPCTPYVLIYQDSDYMKYKEHLTALFKGSELGIKKGSYNGIFITFWFTYPKSTPKDRIVHGLPHQKKPDCDNLMKGLLDALNDSKKIEDDSRFDTIVVRKRYTTEEFDKIQFNLF